MTIRWLNWCLRGCSFIDLVKNSLKSCPRVLRVDLARVGVVLLSYILIILYVSIIDPRNLLYVNVGRCSFMSRSL
jgi:hypothetical protein